MKSGDLVGDRYTLKSHVGSGAFGDVWQALDLTSGLDVALKVLTAADHDARARFDIEARVLHQVADPHCVGPIGSGKLDDGTPFIVTEFVNGETLGEWLKRPTSTADRLGVAVGIASALRAIHRAGIVHRDLKPDNVIVQRANDRWSPKVLDFGIAKVTGRKEQDVTATGVAIGTPGYMSPEQLRGQRIVGAPTDMYAFGVLVFEMFEGRPPFEGRSPMDIAIMHIGQPAPAMLAGPEHVRALVAKLLDKSPAPRPTADHVLALLQPARAATVDPGGDASRAPLFAGAAVVLGIIAVTGVVVAKRPAEQIAPVAVRPPTALLKTQPIDAPAADAAVAPAPDVANVDDLNGMDMGRCGGLETHPAGLFRSPIDRDTWVRLPAGYTPTREYPAILVFHDWFQTSVHGARLLSEEALRGAEEQYIVIAAQGSPVTATRGHWLDDGIRERAYRSMSATLDEFCVDRTRIFAVGYGPGGTPAVRAACADFPIRAIAMFATRWTPGTTRSVGPCLSDSPVPMLMISPDNDPFAPLDGSPACNKSIVIPETKQVAMLRKDRACRGKPTTTEVQGGSCEVHKCDVPLETCIVNGGRAWPDGAGHDQTMELLGRTLNGCTRQETTRFPVSGHILEFFGKQSAR